MRFYKEIIIIILGAVLLWLIYQDFKPEPVEPPEIKEHGDTIKIKQAEIDSISSAFERLQDKMTKDSLEKISERIAFKKATAVLAQKTALERSKVQTLIDTIPVLKSFVALQDSAIQAYSARVDILEQEKARQWSDFNRLLNLEQEKFQAATEINLHLQAINDHWREENKKLRKQNRWLKIGAGIGFVGGLLLRN